MLLRHPFVERCDHAYRVEGLLPLPHGGCDVSFVGSRHPLAPNKACLSATEPHLSPNPISVLQKTYIPQQLRLFLFILDNKSAKRMNLCCGGASFS